MMAFDVIVPSTAAASGACSYEDYSVLSAPVQAVSNHAAAQTAELIELMQLRDDIDRSQNEQCPSGQSNLT